MLWITLVIHRVIHSHQEVKFDLRTFQCTLMFISVKQIREEKEAPGILVTYSSLFLGSSPFPGLER